MKKLLKKLYEYCLKDDRKSYIQDNHELMQRIAKDNRYFEIRRVDCNRFRLDLMEYEPYEYTATTVAEGSYKAIESVIKLYPEISRVVKIEVLLGG